MATVRVEKGSTFWYAAGGLLAGALLMVLANERGKGKSVLSTLSGWIPFRFKAAGAAGAAEGMGRQAASEARDAVRQAGRSAEGPSETWGM